MIILFLFGVIKKKKKKRKKEDKSLFLAFDRLSRNSFASLQIPTHAYRRERERD